MMAYIKKSIIHTYSWQGFTCNIYTCICVYCILLTSVWMSMTTQCAWWKLNFAEMCMDKLNFDKDQFNQCVTIFVDVGTKWMKEKLWDVEGKKSDQPHCVSSRGWIPQAGWWSR